VQVALTLIKIASVLAVVIFRICARARRQSQFPAHGPTHAGTGTIGAFLAALAAGLWAYDGWEDLNLVGSEVQEAAAELPARVGGRCGAGGRDLSAFQRGMLLRAAL